MFVRLYDSTTNALITTFQTAYKTSSTLDQWQSQTFDLSAYAGRSVFLRFEVKTDAFSPSTFFIDDIDLP
jgi:hypothetical protein